MINSSTRVTPKYIYMVLLEYIDNEKFKKFALERFPVILTEKMDKAEPTNIKRLEESMTILLIEYSEQVKEKLFQIKAEKIAAGIVRIADFYYENHVRKGEILDNVESIENYNRGVKMLSSPEIELSYQQLRRRNGNGVFSPANAKRVFESLKTQRVLPRDWRTELLSLDKRNVASVLKLPAAKRRKIEFSDIPKVQQGDFDYLLDRGEGEVSYFGPLFTKCMELYHNSIGLTFDGIVRTKFPNINDKFNMSRFDPIPISEGSSIPSLFLSSEDQENEKVAREEELKDPEKSNFESIHNAKCDPKFNGSDSDSSIGEDGAELSLQEENLALNELTAATIVQSILMSEVQEINKVSARSSPVVEVQEPQETKECQQMQSSTKIKT